MKPPRTRSGTVNKPGANDDLSNVEPIQAANRCRVSHRAIVTQLREEGLQHVATYVRCSLASTPYLQYENHRQRTPCAIFTRFKCCLCFDAINLLETSLW
jgi:hypothetical protein